MRFIRKRREPPTLTTHRACPGADYDGYRDKDTLRAALVEEQRGLCCYCLSRIHPDRRSMKIEHWHSQHGFPLEQLDYSNLLAACFGNATACRDDQHCDTRKGDRVLSRNPADLSHRVEELVHFRGDGVVWSSDPGFDKEINEVLNLNQAFLRNNRKSVLGGLLAALPKRGAWKRSTLEREIREWNGEAEGGDLKPYCQVVVYWLRKRLKRHEAAGLD